MVFIINEAILKIEKVVTEEIQLKGYSIFVERKNKIEVGIPYLRHWIKQALEAAIENQLSIEFSNIESIAVGYIEWEHGDGTHDLLVVVIKKLNLKKKNGKSFSKIHLIHR